eukprot:2285701-Pleurochrysis_carterae.AAC.1
MAPAARKASNSPVLLRAAHDSAGVVGGDTRQHRPRSPYQANSLGLSVDISQGAAASQTEADGSCGD